MNKNLARYCGEVMLLGSIYFLLAWCSYLLLAPSKEFDSIIWLPAGIGLAALIIFDKKLWPGIFIGMLGASLLTGQAFIVALGLAFGSTIEAYIGATLLKQTSFEKTFHQLSDVAIFVICAVAIGPLVGSTITSAILDTGTDMNNMASIGYWARMVLGDALGILIVTPVLLTWKGQQDSHLMAARTFGRIIETIGLIATTSLAGIFPIIAIMTDASTIIPQSSWLLFSAILATPPMLWGSLRFSSSVVSRVLFVLSLAFITHTSFGLIPLTSAYSPSADTSATLLFFDLFLILGNTTALLLSVSMTERRRVHDDIIEQRRELTEFLENATVGIRNLTLDGQITWANRTALEMLGYASYEYIGHYFQEFHVDQQEANALLQFFKKNEPIINYETRLRHKDGSIRHVLVNSRRNLPVKKPYQYRSFIVDITEKKIHEERTRLIADVNQALFEEKHPQKRLARVAELMVSTMADWCAIDVTNETKTTHSVIFHQDPNKLHIAEALQKNRWWSEAQELPPSRVRRTGIAEYYPFISNRLLNQVVGGDPMRLSLLEKLKPRSGLIVPLNVHQKTLGTITLVYAESNRQYNAQDLAFAKDLAHRAASAIEHAELLWHLQRAEKFKNEFLTRLSHELRNPLAAILSSVEVMQTSTVHPLLKYPLEAIERQAKLLTHLIDDLLDISLLSQGRLSLHTDHIAVNDVIEQAVETVRPLMNDRHHKLFVHLPVKPLYLEADSVRLEQIVINLLSNAAKYTKPSGTIQISAARHGDEILIRVQDNGIGIPKEAMNKIFNPFLRISRKEQDQQEEGTGIGLNLVKTLVHLHHGIIDVQSNGPGQGSEFVVHLPIRGTRSTTTKNAEIAPVATLIK